mmetsp:Transcript_13178/g.30696  ORF Transcript_13178/g.30696 Transcript_13178/m.30696 type:complete len:121 (+) Transcript_13178:339-701(+)
MTSFQKVLARKISNPFINSKPGLGRINAEQGEMATRMRPSNSSDLFIISESFVRDTWFSKREQHHPHLSLLRHSCFLDYVCDRKHCPSPFIAVIHSSKYHEKPTNLFYAERLSKQNHSNK